MSGWEQGPEDWSGLAHTTFTRQELVVLLAMIVSNRMLVTETCRLLALPAELRECIYRYALASDGAEDRSAIRYLDDETLVKPPLLRTCSQIRSQAYGIFFEDRLSPFKESLPKLSSRYLLPA